MKLNQLLVLCAFSGSFVQIDAIHGNRTHQSHIKKDIEYGKVLTCKQMEALSTQLTLFPMGTIRMQIASTKIESTLKLSEQKKASFIHNQAAERVFVTEQLSIIIKPVQEFFDVIQDPVILKMITPIITESLNNPQKSFILDFCNSKQSIINFCNDRIQSCRDLESMSKELLHFFGSVEKSISDKARAAAEDLKQKLKLAKKEKQNSEKK